MKEIVAVDIGGTHARFAIAEIEGGRVARLGEPVTLMTSAHAGLELAWEAFGAAIGRPLPRAAAIAFAGPVGGEVLRLTNNPWTIRPAVLNQHLGIDEHVIVNDFGAVGYAVAQCGPEWFHHLCGPDVPLPAEGVISIVGPGTGLGVGQLVQRQGRGLVVETEGGHIDFAPLDPIEDRILGFLRSRHRRVSVERIVAGPGLANIYEALAAIENRPVRTGDDKTLWAAAMAGTDSLASAALERFCMTLGSVAGDIALVHGASGMVIAGGVGLRLRDRLPGSGFSFRFAAKGRFEARMAAMPVKLIVHPQPGLLGAAAAFAITHPN
jgi:glucokinase